MAPPWELRRRGLKDSLRHDQRVKEAIRKNLRELIAEEAIITSDGQKRVRIPLRYLEQYRFKYGQPQEGVGHGPGKPGDLLGRQWLDDHQQKVCGEKFFLLDGAVLAPEVSTCRDGLRRPRHGGAGGARAGLLRPLQQRRDALLVGLSSGPGAPPAASPGESLE